MNPNYNEFRFPQIKSHPWSEVFEPAIEPEAVDLISRLLKYSPVQRFTGVEAMGHPFFAEILKPECTLPNGVHTLALRVFMPLTSLLGVRIVQSKIVLNSVMQHVSFARGKVCSCDLGLIVPCTIHPSMVAFVR